jgi:hypothetical protein
MALQANCWTFTGTHWSVESVCPHVAFRFVFDRAVHMRMILPRLAARLERTATFDPHCLQANRRTFGKVGPSGGSPTGRAPHPPLPAVGQPDPLAVLLP